MPRSIDTGLKVYCCTDNSPENIQIGPKEDFSTPSMQTYYCDASSYYSSNCNSSILYQS